MAVSKEITIAHKLGKLRDLQNVDSELDKIHVLRGELPMEVEDLEDEIEGLTIRLQKLDEEIANFDEEISSKQNEIKECKALIEKYEKQQNSVKNNREFDALTKEVELQGLEIQLCEKRIRDAEKKKAAQIEFKEQSAERLETRKKDLEIKKVELDQIVKETEKEEKTLLVEQDKAREAVEGRLLKAYDRIRKAYRNGLAVVSVERDSCGGCYAKIPPQVQAEIKDEKRFILCEHCGRILVRAAEVEAEA